MDGTDGTPLGWRSYQDGTSGQQGDASEADEPRRRSRMIPTMIAVRDAGRHGITVRELRELTGWHHGMASSALSNLHRSRLIQRLAERRGGCGIYVAPEYLDGREYRDMRSAPDENANQCIPRIRFYGRDIVYWDCPRHGIYGPFEDFEGAWRDHDERKEKEEVVDRGPDHGR